MAGIHKYFQTMTLSSAEETGKQVLVTEAANAAVQHLVTGERKSMSRQVEKASVRYASSTC